MVQNFRKPNRGNFIKIHAIDKILDVSEKVFLISSIWKGLWVSIFIDSLWPEIIFPETQMYSRIKD